MITRIAGTLCRRKTYCYPFWQ